MATEATVGGDGCRLVLRVSAYEIPEAQGFDDANWLTGKVDLATDTTGSFRATHGVALRADELEKFRNDLLAVVESLAGTATLSHLEEQVGCTIALENGRGKLTAFVKEHVGSELSVQECKTDQSYMAQTIFELDAVLKEFPSARQANLTAVAIVCASRAGDLATTELRLEDEGWPFEPLAPASVAPTSQAQGSWS